ncbi:hypothetical protein OYT00_11245 [Microbacterium paraoxydans]|uniref:hypothetical protein n=1 Tax=Microbacterium paraoxydans TaxID=199592 RepID=UPI0022860124|nr:hypothetical protein [Microbacterium paraoxydans]MCZ0710576.1 hypothetical protein [Microbacterium paraoxydans]
MATATRVTGPEDTAPAAPTDDAARYRDSGGTIVNNIGPGTLDNPRIAAREAQYGNRQAEIEAVMAIDESAFDRVRELEAFMIGRAENFVADVMGSTEGFGPRHARRPGLIDKTEEVVTKLNNLVTELERGGSTSDLAERFVALQNEARHTALPKLSRAMREADSHIPKMQNPYAEVQRLITKMPFSSFRPIAPAKRR